jgi:hypothetical protein
MAICIDRCVCFNEPFAQLVQIAASTRCTTIEALQEHIEFGRACRLCHPYMRRALRTGEVVFRTILTDDDEPR